MKFWEAMKLVDEGKKVRRIMWDSKYFVMKLGNRVTVRPPDSNYEPHQSDMLCDGWEMVGSESTEHTPPSDIEEDDDSFDRVWCDFCDKSVDPLTKTCPDCGNLVW